MDTKKKKKEKAVQPRETKAQQDSTQSKELEGVAREKEQKRDVRRMFKILREMWLDIGIKKVDTHKGITVRGYL